MEFEDLHLIEWLRKIQLAWELTPLELSRITHVSEADLGRYLSMSPDEVQALPSIPTGLENGVALVGLYRLLLTVYPTAQEQGQWLERPNSIFEGQRPIDVMAMSPGHLSYITYTVESGLRLGERT